MRTIGVAFPSGSTLKALQRGSVGGAGVRTEPAAGSERRLDFQEMGTFPSKMAFPFVSPSVSPLSD